MPANDIQARRDALLNAAHPRYRHWEVFLTVEDDLKNISRYVDICEDNYETYSIELASLIVRSCTEIEKLAKRISGAERYATFPKFVPPIQTMYTDFATFSVEYPLWDLSFTPWEHVQQNNSPPGWWNQYNTIKHDKNQARLAGNLCNALNAVAGLYVVTLYYQRLVWGKETPRPSITMPISCATKYILPESRIAGASTSMWSYTGFGITWECPEHAEADRPGNS